MTTKPGRNNVCSCGSGKKFKKCCELKVSKRRGNIVMLVIVGLLMAAGVAAGIRSFTSDVSRPSGVWSAEHGHYH